MGKGKPGKIPFFSSILNVRKDPAKMPMMDMRQGNRELKLKSMAPESIE
jgi:hypothetical protein